MRTTVVMPLLFVFVFLWYALPAYARLTAVEPVVKDPHTFPKHKTIFFLEGSNITRDEGMMVSEWMWPFMDGLPDRVWISVSRSEPDQWIHKPSVHIFLLDGGACILGAGAGQTFREAIERLARNLIHQGYFIREQLISISLPHCKPE